MTQEELIKRAVSSISTMSPQLNEGFYGVIGHVIGTNTAVDAVGADDTMVVFIRGREPIQVVAKALEEIAKTDPKVASRNYTAWGNENHCLKDIIEE